MPTREGGRRKGYFGCTERNDGGRGLILILKTRGGGIALRERSRRLIIQFQDSHYLRPPDPSPPAFFRDFSFFLEERVDEFYEWRPFPPPFFNLVSLSAGRRISFSNCLKFAPASKIWKKHRSLRFARRKDRVSKIFKTAPATAVCRRHESRPVKFSNHTFRKTSSPRIFPRARGEDFRRRV